MQTTASVSKTTILWRRTASRFLAISWFLGIALGCLAAETARSVLVDLIRRCVGAEQSIIGVLTVTALPFLLSAFAVSFSKPWLLLFISTCKAFSFSFCAWGICLAFGQSGWLVLFLLLFSDVLLVPLLYFYWLRHIRGDQGPDVWELPVLLAAAITVAFIDHQFVAPFLVALMK